MRLTAARGEFMSYSISQVQPTDRSAFAEMLALLKEQGIRLDPNVDYSCVIYDDDYNVAATGSCSGNTLRCIAVSPKHNGEGLTNTLITHLLEKQFERGNMHVFLYTKPSSAVFFGDLGFYEIVRQENIVFMENKRTGFSQYLKNLAGTAVPGKSAAIVMNANPFTLGHQYLVETAARENECLHLFIVSEEKSPIPFAVRKRLVMEGTKHLNNIIYHDSGSYIISSATFPSYFQKDEEAVNRSHALVDVSVFAKIAEAMNITARYAGEEPRSVVTRIYNQTMMEELPKHGIRCIVIPRKQYGDELISASTVRTLIKSGRFDVLRHYLPETTLSYFMSKEAEPVINGICAMEDTVHY